LVRLADAGHDEEVAAPREGLVFGVGAGIMSVVLVGFELLVAGLQAYIFTILTAVYLAGALEPGH
jgi:F-type H+-transporting ATPase subunit a